MSLFTQPGHASTADLLMDDPRVAGAASIETSGHRHSVRVLPDPRWLEAQTRHASVAASRSLLGWQSTHDLADRVPQRAPQPGLDGWADSFTGRPPSDGAMRVWLDAIASRLLALPHARVREIGCGTGLLVRELATHCRVYEASDVSAVAVSQLRAWLATRDDLRHVRTRRQPAHEGGGAAAGFDLVVINAVAQHFPDADYLRTVLDAAWRDVAPGGHLVVGDVRLLGLQSTLVAASTLARAPGGTPVHALRQSIHATWLAQSDLALDPAFFHRFASACGASVAVRLKPGDDALEMMRYRCDVVLGKPASAQAVSLPAASLDSVEALRGWLAAGRPGRVLLRAQPDARLAADIAAHRLIASAVDSMLVREVRRLVALQVVADRPASGPEFFHNIPLPYQVPRGAGGSDPAAIAALCAAQGCSTMLLATPYAQDARFDLLVERHAAGAGTGQVPDLQPAPDSGPLDDPALASHPLLLQSLRRLSASLYNELARLLPEADMPARILPVVRRDQLIHGAP
ncbi:class I SAM-dependent methyltransferase [Lichenicoccus sp.]|uniref:class I SAM-dependent methyltransferase n=1 Tax=Lichenicoccus sp. TaxID=2781899 RepID=UPI003D0F01E7